MDPVNNNVFMCAPTSSDLSSKPVILPEHSNPRMKMAMVKIRLQQWW